MGSALRAGAADNVTPAAQALCHPRNLVQPAWTQMRIWIPRLTSPDHHGVWRCVTANEPLAPPPDLWIQWKTIVGTKPGGSRHVLL